MSAPQSSKTAVVTALAANLLIVVAKFVAFGFSGSSAMLSEAIHSCADAGNQALLFLGLRRGSRERDEEFHYGYGAERFVFGMLSAAGIFFVGAGVTVWHGITGFIHPHEPEIGPITWIVLAVSFVIEGGSMAVAVNAVAKERGSVPFFKYMREHADPAALAIILEDGAALIGLVLAAVGIVLAVVTGDARWDAAGSILVGIVLGWVAVHLAKENRELLLGKAVPLETLEKFNTIVLGTPGIRFVHDVKTEQLTPETYKFKAEITIDEAFLAQKIDESAQFVPKDLEAPARPATMKRLAESAVGAISDIIDDIEVRIRKEIPEAKHIDLEVDHSYERKKKKAELAAQAASTPTTA